MENVLDKSKCEVYECKFSDIRHILEGFHYKKGHMGGGISMCFAMFLNGKLVGGSVLGKPRHEKSIKTALIFVEWRVLIMPPKIAKVGFYLR